MNNETDEITKLRAALGKTLEHYMDVQKAFLLSFVEITERALDLGSKTKPEKKELII